MAVLGSAVRIFGYKSTSQKQKSQIWSQNDLRRLDLGNECIFLHLATTTDTISYVSGPVDAKNDPKISKKNQVGGIGGAKRRAVFYFLLGVA